MKVFKELYDKVNPKTERLIQHMILIRLEADGVEANIPVKPRNDGERMPYDVKGYWLMRSAVERFNAWLKTFRMAIIRYERLAIMFKAIFACIMIHMRYGL